MAFWISSSSALKSLASSLPLLDEDAVVEEDDDDEDEDEVSRDASRAALPPFLRCGAVMEKVRCCCCCCCGC